MPAPVSRTFGPDGRMPRIVLITLAALLVLAIGWAAIAQARASSLQGELQQLQQDNALLRANATATAYAFTATDIAPPNLRGTVFLTVSSSGVVAVSNLPPAGDDHVFQLWFLGADDTPPIAAGSLFVTPTGEGFALLPADSGSYSRIAISLEPAGTTTSSGGYLLVADVNPVRGVQAMPVK